MKKNQAGFSALEGILVIVVISILVGTGWFVWNARAKSDISTEKPVTSTTNKKPATMEEDTYVVPEGYRMYENKDLGFKFSYPAEWGDLTAKADSDSLLSIETQKYVINETDKLVLTVTADKTENFKTFANYKQVRYSPVAEGIKYNWVLAESGLGGVAGAPIEGEGLPIAQYNNVTVYGLAGGHACDGNQQWLFATNENFIGLNISFSNCYIMAKTRSDIEIAAYEAEYAKLKNDIEKVATAISVEE